MVDVLLDRRASLEDRARLFATAWHASIGQVREQSGLEYITHPAAVVEIVRSVTHEEQLLAAAWLHDVVEDTPCTLGQVQCEFGEYVAALVSQLSKVATPSDGDRAQRFSINLAHTASASPPAKTIKLADIIHNASDLHECPYDFAARFVAEKGRLLEVLREGDVRLLRRAEAVLETAARELGLPIAV